jgi:hypothetical protein
MDSATGVMDWTPSKAGNYTLWINVTDGHVTVSKKVGMSVVSPAPPAVNHAPSIIPIPGRTVTEGDLIKFDVKANDSDKDALSYQVNGHKNVSIDSTGKLTWQTREGDAGEYTITVSVSDEEFTTNASFKVTIEKAVVPVDVNGTEPISTTLIIAGIAVGAFVIAIVIILVVVLLKRKRTDAAGPGATPSQPPTAPAPAAQYGVQTPAPMSPQPRKASPVVIKNRNLPTDIEYIPASKAKDGTGAAPSQTFAASGVSAGAMGSQDKGTQGNVVDVEGPDMTAPETGPEYFEDDSSGIWAPDVTGNEPMAETEPVDEKTEPDEAL